MEKQTAGRKILGELAPKFAELNDDVLFEEVYRNDDIKEEHGGVFGIGEPLSDEQYNSL